MIKLKSIKLILDKDVTVRTKLKNGTIISLNCEIIDADYDRLYLAYSDEMNEYIQYFFEDKVVLVDLDTIDGRRTYPSYILYPPENNLIVVEYYHQKVDKQKRMNLRVKTSQIVDVILPDKVIPMITINISAGGLKMISSEPLEEGEVYNALLTLATNTPKIELKFKVLSVNFFKAEKKYEIIAEYVDLSNTDEKKIVKFCYEKQSRTTPYNFDELI